MHMLQALAAMARANPDHTVWIKLRHLPNENQKHLHLERYHYPGLLEELDNPPPNLKLTACTMDEALATAALQNIAAGFHHPSTAAGMNIDHPHALLCRRLNGSRHCIRNIVKLEVEKDFETPAMQRFEHIGAAAREQLLANLETTALGVQSVRHAQRGVHGGIVECDDQGR